jgi:hypothetical protein
MCGQRFDFMVSWSFLLYYQIMRTLEQARSICKYQELFFIFHYHAKIQNLVCSERKTYQVLEVLYIYCICLLQCLHARQSSTTYASHKSLSRQWDQDPELNIPMYPPCSSDRSPITPPSRKPGSYRTPQGRRSRSPTHPCTPPASPPAPSPSP